MSNQNSTVSDARDAATFLIPEGILLGLTILTSIARFYTRYRPRWLLKWDDYVLAFTLPLTIVWYALVAVMYSYGRVSTGPGRIASILGPLGLTCGVLWFFSMNLIRVSMCLSILRLKDSKRWKWPLWGLIAVQVLLIISSSSVSIAYCRPVSAAWTGNPNAKCLTWSQMEAYAYTYNAFNVASDLILSLIPLLFIVNMHRARSEKILIGCLMAAGLLASVFGVLRLVILLGYFRDRGMIWLQVRSDILCASELMVATIAASLPCLKAPTERVLHRVGILHASSTVARPSYYEEMTFDSYVKRQVEGFPLTDCGGSTDRSRGSGRAEI